MAKFVFRLQTILNYKKQIESLRKNELASAIKVFEKEKAILRGLHFEMDQTVIKIRRLKQGQIDIVELKLLDGYCLYLKDKINAQTIVVQKAEAFVEEKKRALVEAMRERKLLENLREKKLKEFLYEERKNEQKVSEEIFGFKYAKTLVSGE